MKITEKEIKAINKVVAAQRDIHVQKKKITGLSKRYGIYIYDLN